jgi:hypothetical protein
MPVEIFCCYSRKDQLLLEELIAHLFPLKRQELITIWAAKNIEAGTEWEHEIEKHLNTAQIILLLISSDFIRSDYCSSKEMTRAMERHNQGEAQVIPIILRPCLWQKEPFGKLQALPTDAKPITSAQWRDLDEAFLDVAEGIRKVAEEKLREKPPESPVPPETPPQSHNPMPPSSPNRFSGKPEYEDDELDELLDDYNSSRLIRQRAQRKAASIDEPDKGVHGPVEYPGSTNPYSEIEDIGDEGDYILPQRFSMPRYWNRHRPVLEKDEGEDELPPLADQSTRSVSLPRRSTTPLPYGSVPRRPRISTRGIPDAPKIIIPDQVIGRPMPGSMPTRSVSLVLCSTCQGTGKVRHVLPNGRFVNVTECKRCHGAGRVALVETPSKSKRWFWILAVILLTLLIFIVLPGTWSILIRVISALISSALVISVLRVVWYLVFS